jgi:quinol monooxygenase YgiN
MQALTPKPTKEDPMSTNLNSQVGVLIKFTAQPGQGLNLADLLASVAPKLAHEHGTLLWQVDRQVDQPDTVFLYERYENSAALAAHNESKLNAETRAAMGVFLAGPPQVFPLIPVGGIH